MNSAYKQQPTGILWGEGGARSAFTGSGLLPRSIASDGRRMVLVLHVLVHLLALAANIVSCVYFFEDFRASSPPNFDLIPHVPSAITYLFAAARAQPKLR